MLSYCRETALQPTLVLAIGLSERLELGDNISRTLYVYLQPLWHNWPESYWIRWKKREIRAITAFVIVQDHRVRYQSKARMRLPI